MKNLKQKGKIKVKRAQAKNEKGITLIALVVTIVVLLILAGISISIVLGEGGIIDSARKAGELTNAAIANEQQMLQNLIDLADEYLSGNGGSGSSNTEEDPPTPPEEPTKPEASIILDKTDESIKVGDTLEIKATVSPEEKQVEWSSNAQDVIKINNGKITAVKKGTAIITASIVGESDKKATCNINVEKTTVADIIGKEANKENNLTVEDDYGNMVVIPSEFTVLANNTENEYTSKVEYKYSGDGRPQVQDGIVVQDGDGNQFVWIPVGTITNKAGASEAITKIKLTRRVFGTDGQVTSEKEDGTELKTSSSSTYGYLEEAKTDSGLSTTYKNAIAKDIENGFKASVTSKGGYYIARYEASYGGENKPLSKVSTGEPITQNGVSNAPTQVGMLWNNITQIDAANAARAMYPDGNVISDLVNSYAWDTAIYFIQKYSGKETYSQAKGTDYGDKTNLKNTGTNGDKVCNIYDMAGNCREWTTETCTNPGYPCVFRGGSCNISGYYTGNRSYSTTSNVFHDISFRLVLYM